MCWAAKKLDVRCVFDVMSMLERLIGRIPR
jgi:hypothetical protein